MTTRADIAALVIPCPRCGAAVGEPCDGLAEGSHMVRVSAWQRAERDGHLARPQHERDAVASIIADIRAGFARQGKGCGNDGAT